MGNVLSPGQVDDSDPFPGLTRPRSPVREGTRLSLAVGGLVERRDQLREMIDRLLEEHRVACEQVADADPRYEKKSAEEYVRAEGAVKLREKLALLGSLQEYTDLQDALAARRITEKALHALEKDLEALRAFAWAHQAEIKTLEG